MKDEKHKQPPEERKEPAVHNAASFQKLSPAADKNKLNFSSEQEVWRAFKAGDQAAFMHIYRQYFPVLFRYGSQFTRDRELIKDCIQDLFIELSEKRERLAWVRSIKIYLFKALRNRVVACLKKQQKIFISSEAADGFDFHFCLSREQTMITQQIHEEKQRHLNQALQKLTPRQREIIYYVYQEGLSFAEIKELMKLRHLKSAQNLLYKTIGILKQYLTLSSLIYMLFYELH